jgi:DNA-binding NarL/FixJ family response regulator
VRVAIADDSLLIREGIARVLVSAEIGVCGLARNGSELLELVAAEAPDIAIIDIRMPPTHTTEGLVSAAAVRARHPATAVLVLSQYIEAEYALTLLGGGGDGCGYLLKDCVTRPGDLVDALARLVRGEVVVDQELVEQLLSRTRPKSPLDELSPRERSILALMAEGLTDRGIAERLWLSRKTVETHVRHILQKLGLAESPERNRRVIAVLTYLRG